MNTQKNIKLYIVVPCYNEEAVIEDSNTKLLNKLNSLQEKQIISSDSKVVYVNDGSSDKTAEIITNLSNIDNRIGLISLAHNRGHQNALLCGLLYVKNQCDVTISIDADLQDDIDTIDDMLENYINGSKIVYGIRNNRDTDSAFKRYTAEGYYKVLNALGVETVFNHADYRLMDNKALEILSEYNESNLYLRGIIPQIGLKTSQVYYKRKERLKGESKYNLTKMISLAVNGITSCSTKPLQIALVLCFFNILLAIVFFVCYAAFKNIWLVLAGIIFFCNSMLLAVLGVISTYIGKIMIEVKQRPKYNIDYTIGLNDDK